MAIVNTHYGFCAKGGAAVKFTYTGNYNVRDDGVVELLTSGTITFLSPAVIDIFCVGGGGGGSTGNANSGGYGGGGGGYTATLKRNSVDINIPYEVKIGNGGEERHAGEQSSFGTLITANGGSGGSTSFRNGAPGGSGGGGGTKSTPGKGYGGSNGENGGAGDKGTGGAGQGSTTREFGEEDGRLYAGGGGGGSYFDSATPEVNMGGAGGGGNGAWLGSSTYESPSQAGAANTGGGGGGGASNAKNKHTGGASGGSGIVCFREAQKLPELAGTWVLNERLYAPENDIQQSINFTAATGGGTSRKCDKVIINNTYLTVHSTDVSTNLTVYQFTTNSWDNKLPQWTFPVGATTSDEFRAWLASNATKQS